jgi:signal peptidase I
MIKRTFKILASFFLFLLVLYFFVYRQWGVCLFELESPSMEPLIHGSNLPKEHGDTVFATKIFRRAALRTNDLVVVDLNVEGISVTTVRKITGCAGNHYLADSNQVSEIPKGYLYLSAESKAGYDSRQAGLFKIDQVRAKVLFIIHAKAKGS